jgi:hypothetical protein
MAEVLDKGSGKTDWEVHSLRYVVNAITSAQKRQQKLWNQLAGRRTADGLIPIDWPLIEEYVEAVRRTYSLMVDLETVSSEFERKFGKGGRRKSRGRAQTAGTAARKRRKKR